MKKWLVCAAMSMVLTLTGVGCNGVDENNSNPTPSPTIEETVTPGVKEEVTALPSIEENTVSIAAIEEADYLGGLNLIRDYEIDVDEDGTEEIVGLYSNAQVDASGELLLDDGQEWALIVRKGDTIYPLVERMYIQMGILGVTIYTDYEQDETIHILADYRSGAGMSTYDFTYDAKESAFIGRTLYEADNINTLVQWW